MGSRRTTPTLPVMAAVVSVLMAEPRKTPWFQSKASKTSGITCERREPKRSPEIGTPCGSSQFGATDGHWWTGTVKREFGWAAGPEAGSHGRPCQSSSPRGAWGVSPSHQGSRSGVSGHVGEDRVRADHRGGVGIGLGARIRRHAEEAALGVDRAELAGRVDVQPGDVVARPSTRASPAACETTMARLVLPDALGMAPRQVGDPALRVLDADDQHVLGEPALVARLRARPAAARGTSCRAARCRRSPSPRSRSASPRGSAGSAGGRARDRRGSAGRR